MSADQIPDVPQELVLTYAPARTVLFVAGILVMATSTGRSVWHGFADGFGPFDLVGAAVTGMLLYVAAMSVIHAILHHPLLWASPGGVWILNPWGRLFVRWDDIAALGPGRFRWLRIRLRDGARPVGSTWVRLLSASVWVRNTTVVPMFATLPRPNEVADALQRMQARYHAA
jgi:hypothetical protein